ncbi:hypothetical protein AHAS_Ahas13G0364500 [Arachis hypogaea]
MESEEEDKESDEKHDEQDVLVEKSTSGLYNLVISDAMKKPIRDGWWDTYIVKLLGKKISFPALKRRLEDMIRMDVQKSRMEAHLQEMRNKQEEWRQKSRKKGK